MFRENFILFFIILFSIFGKFSYADRNKYSIGIIIDNNNEDTELAFVSAIDRMNVDERSFELVPVIKYASETHTTVMEKLACELISEGVIAIYGPSADVSNVVSSICHTFEIPHFLFDYKKEIKIKEREYFSMTINVHPNDLVLARAYASIIQSFAWRRHSILYERDVDLMQMQDVLQIHNPKDFPVTVRQLEADDDQDFRPLLKEMREWKENNLIIASSTESFIPIFRQAADLGMLTDYENLFFTSLDAHTMDLEDLAHTTANVSAIRIFDPTDFNVKSIVYDWEQRKRREGEHYKTPPDKAKTAMLVLSDAVWVFAKGLADSGVVDEMEIPQIDCESDQIWPWGRKIIETIKGARQEGATGRIDFDENGRRKYFTAYIMEVDTEGFTEYSRYDPVNGIAIEQNESNLKKKEVQLANKVFIVSSRIGKPFLFNRSEYVDEPLTGNDRYEGYSMDLIDAISKIVGFKYTFELAPDGNYGGVDKKTGQWNGIVRQVMDEKADLGICDLTMTSTRRQVVDFTPPFMTLGISILFSKPVPEPPDLFSFRLPFSTPVWMYMSACLFGICFLVFITARMAPEDWENPHPCEEEPEELENVWTIPNTVWLAIGSLMGQGCDLLPKSASTRILLGMWWFFALMMLNSYTANLAAFLTKSQTQESINNIEDLAKQNKIKYGTVFGGSTMGFFRDSDEPLYQKMWSFMENTEPSVFTTSNDIGEDRVLKSKREFAFFMESSVLEYKAERNCDLIQVGNWLDFKTYGIAMPFNSPYRKLISEAVLKMGEQGILADIKRRWWKERNIEEPCKKDDAGGSDALKLKIQNVGGVFLVLGMGLFVAFVIGIIDFFYTIQNVALEEKMSMCDAFKQEILFALKFWITEKPVTSSSKAETSSSRTSLTGSLKKSGSISKISKSSRSNKHDVKHSKNNKNDDDIVMSNMSDHRGSVKELDESKSGSKKSKLSLSCLKV